MKHSHLAALMALCFSFTLSTATAFAAEAGKENPETQEEMEEIFSEEEGTDAENAAKEDTFYETETASDDIDACAGDHAADTESGVSETPDQKSEDYEESGSRQSGEASTDQASSGKDLSADDQMEPAVKLEEDAEAEGTEEADVEQNGAETEEFREEGSEIKDPETEETAEYTDEQETTAEYTDKQETTAEMTTAGTSAGQEDAAADTVGQTAALQESTPVSGETIEPVNEVTTAIRSLASNVEGKIAQMKLEVFDDLDKGYGDSQMLSSGGKRLLIDTDYSGAWGVLNDWLNGRQYTDFDIYISHYHDDHMGNVQNILNDGKYKVNKLYLPDYGYMTGSSSYMRDYIDACESMMDTARNKGVEIVYLAKGSIFNVGDVTAEVLWGTDYKNSTHNTNYINNNSLVTRFTCGDIRYLNAGDIEEDTEYDLLENNVDVSADIFKLNHHGGDTSNKYEFIKAVNAAYYYYTYCEDTPTRYSPYNTWTYDSVKNAEQFGNVASVRYNGNIIYNVYDNVITQELERNCSTQAVYIYDPADPEKLMMLLTQDFNNASTKRIDERAYGSYDYTTSKRSGTYAEDGWLWGNGEQQYYYKNNQPVKGWLQDQGKWYYLNPNTAKKEKGWLTWGGDTYFLNEQGVMQTGFVKIGAAVHHFNDQGHQTKTGWAQIDGKWYYFGAYNKLTFGWNYLSGKWYYMDGSGVMQTGRIRVGGKIYVMSPSGSMYADGWAYSNGSWYYLNSDGSAVTGWKYVSGKWYFMNDDGRMLTGKITPGGVTYILSPSGSMYAGGWAYCNGSWYYLNNDGSAVTGWKYVSGDWYFMNYDGRMLTGKITPGGVTYILGSSGRMYADSWAYENGKWYYLNSDGSAATGWKYVSGDWYFMNDDGTMLTGKITPGGVTYILRPSGSMYADSWAYENGKWYYLNSDGSAATGWKYVSGKWYYMNREGVMQTGWQKIGGVWYFLNGDGAWVENPI